MKRPRIALHALLEGDASMVRETEGECGPVRHKPDRHSVRGRGNCLGPDRLDVDQPRHATALPGKATTSPPLAGRGSCSPPSGSSGTLGSQSPQVRSARVTGQTDEMPPFTAITNGSVSWQVPSPSRIEGSRSARASAGAPRCQCRHVSQVAGGCSLILPLPV